MTAEAEPLPADSVTGSGGELTVDAAVLAPRLGLDMATLKREMRRGVVYSRVERGEGADAGNWRITVTYRARRVCLLVTEDGGVHAVPPPRPAGGPGTQPRLLDLVRRAAGPPR